MTRQFCFRNPEPDNNSFISVVFFMLVVMIVVIAIIYGEVLTNY